MRIAFLSGGKDSLYAAMQVWPIDYGVLLIYDFPRPSPHLLNLGKSVETILLTGVPVIVMRLQRGREREQTIELLQRLNATELVAGDVYVEDHLKYMESIAGEVGAELREPLWGMDPEEVLHREVDAGIVALVTGAEERLRSWVGRVLDAATVTRLIGGSRRLGADPLGERGEYHTLVLASPLHERRLEYQVCRRLTHETGYVLLKLC